MNNLTTEKYTVNSKMPTKQAIILHNNVTTIFYRMRKFIIDAFNNLSYHRFGFFNISSTFVTFG